MKPLLALILLAGITTAPAPLTERQRAQHALSRLGFGARPGEVDRVVKIGVDRWIAQQLHPERIDDRAIESRLAQYATLAMSDDEVMRTFAKPLYDARRERRKNGEDEQDVRKSIPRELRPQRLIEELSSQRILRAAASERQLNEVMVDFWMNHFNVFAGKGLDRFLIASYERDAIRPRVWGTFEELLLATAKSPAMLFYLDNAQSGARGSLNENYARELMELHTLGVDGGYTQKDVTELARVLTGWSISRPNEGRMDFVFRTRLHDSGAKTVLGTRVAAGGGVDEGERMIRFLARHPSTARHIATKLARRLVADEPPKALVDRVAKRFLETRGDLRATVKAVIDSPEFWSATHYRAKVKSPFEYAISAVRAVNGTIEDPLPLARELRRIGQPLYFAQPPTGYSDAAEAWVNSGALLHRMNFALALAAGKLPGVHVGTLPAIDPGMELSSETKKVIRERGSDPALVAGLVLGSPEFQRQ